MHASWPVVDSYTQTFTYMYIHSYVHIFIRIFIHTSFHSISSVIHFRHPFKGHILHVAEASFWLKFWIVRGSSGWRGELPCYRRCDSRRYSAREVEREGLAGDLPPTLALPHRTPVKSRVDVTCCHWMKQLPKRLPVFHAKQFLLNKLPFNSTLNFPYAILDTQYITQPGLHKQKTLLWTRVRLTWAMSTRNADEQNNYDH